MAGDEAMGVLWISEEIANELRKVTEAEGARLSPQTVRYLADSFSTFRGSGLVLRIHPPMQGELRTALLELIRVGKGQHLDPEKVAELKARFPDAFNADPSLAHRLIDPQVIRGLIVAIQEGRGSH
ncbi:MAG: hypothetical protein ABR507_08875 [Actinomycetota bacterium]|nr:hypothetical protein [Actinomycetota bacterium]